MIASLEVPTAHWHSPTVGAGRGMTWTSWQFTGGPRHETESVVRLDCRAFRGFGVSESLALTRKMKLVKRWLNSSLLLNVMWPSLFSLLKSSIWRKLLYLR